jgi:hypothetical protein
LIQKSLDLHESADSISFSNHGPWGLDGATVENVFIHEKYSNFFLRNHWAKKAQIYMEAF